MHRRFFLPAGLIFVFIVFFYLKSSSESKSKPRFYRTYGANYDKATDFIRNNPDISLLFQMSGIQADFAWAIVFPELIRYKSLQDKLELASLYTLYVSRGESYSDFSVGNFQMKPSFIERLEKDYLRAKTKLILSDDFNFDTADNRKSRIERLKRMEDRLWQAKYLSIFIKLLDLKYENKNWAGNVSKLKFYATAYNAGYWLTGQELEKISKQKFFHVSLMTNHPGKKYAYCDIVEEYYVYGLRREQ